MLKLRALEKLCSPEFYDDPSLLTAADKRILELLLLRLGEQKTTGPKVVKKLAVLEGYEALGMACCAPNNNCGRASSYMTQAKDGYEKLLGPNHEKALLAELRLLETEQADVVREDGMMDLMKRMVKARLENHNVVVLESFDALGLSLGRWEGRETDQKAMDFYEKCLKGRLKTLGLVYTDTLSAMASVGSSYVKFYKPKKALELLEKSLKGMERTLEVSHPVMIRVLLNLAEVHKLWESVEAEDYYERALRGCIDCFGKKHLRTRKTLQKLEEGLCRGSFEHWQKRKREIATEYQGIEEVGGFFVDEGSF